MKKFLLTFSVLVIPFIAQAPTMFENKAEPMALQAKIEVEPKIVINTVEEQPVEDSYHVVKEWGRYKVINVDDVLEVPEFFRKKSEAVEFAKDMNNSQYSARTLLINN